MSNLALFFVISTIGMVACSPPVPVWSDVYSVKGFINLPYAELGEPFEAWYDGKLKNSRIDYYDGTVKSYQLGENGYGIIHKVNPVTTYEEINKMTCFSDTGSKDEVVTPQSVLPDVSDFKYKGSETHGDKEVQVWSLTTTEGEKENVYTLWTYNDENGNAIPIKYDMKGFNSLIGSHYDHYYLEYVVFSTEQFSSSIFEEDDELCSNSSKDNSKHIQILNPMAEFIRPETNQHIDSRFNEFINDHNKKYADNREHTFRKEVFRQNVRFIESVNRQNKGYYLAVNHLADKTDEERKYLKGRISNGGLKGAQPFQFKDYSDDNLPDQFDWRLYGAVSQVKDQAICGSCWAFGVVGHLEGAMFVKNGGKNLVRLSEQALVDCSWGSGNGGCNGGLDEWSYEWLKKSGGIPTDADYGSYLGVEGFCHADKLNKTAQILGFVHVAENNEQALRLAIFNEGPISVAIDAGPKSFDFYSHGVYYEETCLNGEADLNHAVLAVGYGTINGENYWLIKNSWSAYWGDNGYVLMSSRNNNCGVMTAATYVRLA